MRKTVKAVLACSLLSGGHSLVLIQTAGAEPPAASVFADVYPESRSVFGDVYGREDNTPLIPDAGHRKENPNRAPLQK